MLSVPFSKTSRTLQGMLPTFADNLSRSIGLSICQPSLLQPFIPSNVTLQLSTRYYEWHVYMWYLCREQSLNLEKIQHGAIAPCTYSQGIILLSSQLSVVSPLTCRELEKKHTCACASMGRLDYQKKTRAGSTVYLPRALPAGVICLFNNNIYIITGRVNPDLCFGLPVANNKL